MLIRVRSGLRWSIWFLVFFLSRDYVFNLTNIAEGGLPFSAKDKYINASGMGEGLVGGALPVVVFYFPVDPTSKVLPKSIPAGASRYVTGVHTPSWPAHTFGSRLAYIHHPIPSFPPVFGTRLTVCMNCLRGPARGHAGTSPLRPARSRYWTMVAAPTPDMQGSREQGARQLRHQCRPLLTFFKLFLGGVWSSHILWLHATPSTLRAIAHVYWCPRSVDANWRLYACTSRCLVPIRVARCGFGSYRLSALAPRWRRRASRSAPRSTGM